MLGVCASAGVAATLWRLLAPSPEERLAAARQALVERDFAQAETLALSVATRPGTDGWAWMVAAEAAARAGRPEDALAHYEQVRDGTSELRAAAAYGRGELCFQLGRQHEAAESLRLALQFDSRLVPAQRRLVDLYHRTGQTYRAAPWLQQLLLHSVVTLEDLFHAGDPDHAVSLPESVWEAVRDGTADPLEYLGAASEALALNRAAEARGLYERVLHILPGDLDALAGLGQSLLLSDTDELGTWQAALPDQADRDAAVASVLGQIADREGRHAYAVRYFARVVAERPTSRVAWHRLGQSLSRAGRKSDAERALARANTLQQLAVLLDDLFKHRTDIGLLGRVAAQLARMGRAIEAAGWSQYALSLDPQQTWARELLAQLQRDPRALIDEGRESDLSALLAQLAAEAGEGTVIAPPVRTGPAQSPGVDVVGPPSAPPAAGAPRIRFVDTAPASGLDFVYRSARKPEGPGARIIETTGGGVAALDYDSDGWPDLYFTQGSRVFPPLPVYEDHDRLMRNCRGRLWTEVTGRACLADEGFGQGVAAGDFNDDGFTDLYVANYGINRLFQNQGDGTFLDVTPAAMLERPVWTSSCVIVDLNRDGAPDLFDATYCRGADVETRLCGQDGVVRSCSPRAFASEPDRMWLGTGNGDWRLAENCGLDLPDSYGLGVVAFRTAPEAPLGLFIANDEVPNHWLIDEDDSPGQSPRWSDHARLGGLAGDASGQSQACMGVACGDADNDGLPDLFVTNFYRESNTLYRALSLDLFEDQTQTARLRDPGWHMLGFGTQFLDADLDGWPDLIVANGHIDDLSASGEPFEMPPQFIRNLGGTFRELASTEAGECFARRALGRGLARLDWNGDGREDAVIVNQESPAALLTNESEPAGRPLVLRLRATQGARDAIGTIVKVRAGDRRLTRQVTAGDGYQASNERVLVIGVPDSGTVEVEVFWAVGAPQSIGPLAPGTGYVVVQRTRSARALPIGRE